MNAQQLNILAGVVQHNCHISDARHGADYSLCIYLMKMREYFRWEQRLPYGAALQKDAVGDWLQAREQLWEQLEDADLAPLCIDGQDYDPYDADAINDALSPHGLVYSSGLGNRAKPHFFLGELERHAQNGACSVYVAASEYARDLTAPPAMTRGSSIFLRRESLSRMLWEKLESWRWNRPDNALGRAFACYDFDTDLDASLAAMTDREVDNALLHEQGEYQAGQLLGDDAWNAMLLDLAETPAELMARAVRDHLADCLVTLPRIGALARAQCRRGAMRPMRASMPRRCTSTSAISPTCASTSSRACWRPTMPGARPATSPRCESLPSVVARTGSSSPRTCSDCTVGMGRARRR